MSSGRALKGGERWRADRPEVEIARAFYVDVLGGRQVWPPDAPPRRSLWFLVGGALIEVGPEVRSATTRSYSAQKVPGRQRLGAGMPASPFECCLPKAAPSSCPWSIRSGGK